MTQQNAPLHSQATIDDLTWMQTHKNLLLKGIRQAFPEMSVYDFSIHSMPSNRGSVILCLLWYNASTELTENLSLERALELSNGKKKTVTFIHARPEDVFSPRQLRDYPHLLECPEEFKQ